MPRPVIVRYPDETALDGNGREYEIESATAAKRVHPNAEIVRFADDNSEYSAEAARRRPATPAPRSLEDAPEPPTEIAPHTPDEPAPPASASED